LRELVPTLRRVITFYDPGNPSAISAVVLARDAARRLGIDLIERQVASAAQIGERLRALSAGDADAYLFIPDAMVSSQDAVILATANALRIPTMAYELNLVRKGALAGYGVNYGGLGRQAADYVNLILAGARPGDLPIAAVNTPALAVN